MLVYIGYGNSTSKKNAQENAASDFTQFLVRQGFVLQSEVPGGWERWAAGGVAKGGFSDTDVSTRTLQSPISAPLRLLDTGSMIGDFRLQSKNRRGITFGHVVDLKKSSNQITWLFKNI